MSNAQKEETKASAAQPTSSSAPDGKSKLPDIMPDFPGNPTDPVTSSAPVK